MTVNDCLFSWLISHKVYFEFEGYFLRKGFSADSLRGFEKSCDGDRKSVEVVMNHLHIKGIQHYGCVDSSIGKFIILGDKLKEIYGARLRWKFPEKPCSVSFYRPEDENDLEAYEITFWQKT